MMVTGAMQTAPMEDPAMSAAKLLVGLCVTCNNAENCVYRKRRGRDAIYCETFDGYALPNGKGVARIVVMMQDTVESTEFKGLCVNCAHRDDCKLPRPAGGVWHCEEYE